MVYTGRDAQSFFTFCVTLVAASFKWLRHIVLSLTGEAEADEADDYVLPVLQRVGRHSPVYGRGGKRLGYTGCGLDRPV